MLTAILMECSGLGALCLLAWMGLVVLKINNKSVMREGKHEQQVSTGDVPLLLALSLQGLSLLLVAEVLIGHLLPLLGHLQTKI